QVGVLDPHGSRPGGGGLLVQHEQRGDVTAGVADSDRMCDERVGTQSGLDLGGSDVLASRGDDEFLLAVGDRYDAAVVHRAHVPGGEPTVSIGRVHGLAVVVQVTGEDHGPPNE